MTKDDAMLGEDDYESGFYYFQKALLVLAEDPQAQCEAMDYFNVAWEIRDDVLRGVHAVLGLAGNRLSEHQKEAMAQLKADLECLASTAVYIDNRREDHLLTMSGPSWAPLRLQAKELIELFEFETKRVSSILGLD